MRTILTAVPLVFALLLAGCGGNVKSASNPPATPAANPAPPSGGSGGSTSPAVTASVTHYEASLVGPNSAALGKITVDNGNVTYQFSGWSANQQYSIDFCQFPVMRPSACFAVNAGSTTNSSGAAQGTFRFNPSGTYYGWFRFNTLPDTTTSSLMSGFTPAFAGGSQYVAALTLHTANIDQLKSGEVRVNNATIHVQVVGAAPNATYHVMEANAFEGEDEVGVLMTDANGNGSVDLAAKNPRGLVTLGQTSTGNDAIRATFVVP